MDLKTKRLMVFAGLALAVAAIVVIFAPVLAANDDYGVDSGASGSSVQNKYATQTAVAVYLTDIAHQTVSPTPTPIPPTATPTSTDSPDDGNPTPDPTNRRRD